MQMAQPRPSAVVLLTCKAKADIPRPPATKAGVSPVGPITGPMSGRISGRCACCCRPMPPPGAATGLAHFAGGIPSAAAAAAG